MPNTVIVSPYFSSSQKRLFDLFLSLSILWFFWPFLVCIAVLIVLDSGWPIFFLQERVGQNKKSFLLYKFRTMHLGSEQLQSSLSDQNQAPSPMFKVVDDPRFTRLGRLLSRTGVDELPQLINILLGEMSWVGPRPLPVKEAKKLPSSWDFRYSVLPGITSLWAINTFRYQNLDKWRQLEVETVRTGSVSSDIKLLIQTALYIAGLHRSNSDNS